MTGKQLKNSILQWAIQGKLVPQDPNDEPASVLLERIREEKARLIKEKKIKKDKNESIIYRGDDNSHYEKILATGEVKCIDDEIPFEIPKSWEWCRLGNITTIIGGYAFPSNSIKSSNGIRVIRISDFNNGKILEHKGVMYNGNLDLSQYQIFEKDILMAMTGGTVGKCVLLPQKVKEPMLLNQRVALIRNFYVYEKYIYTILISNITQEVVNTQKNSTNDNISMEDIYKFLIPLPSLSEQQRIVERLEMLLPLIEQYSKAYLKLETLNREINNHLKKSILQYAIKGNLVAQCDTDEPATVLLERIREEKKKLVASGKLKKKDLTDSTIFKGDDNKYYEKCGIKVTCIDNEVPFTIPESWQWARLGELITTKTGLAYSKPNLEIKSNKMVRVLRGGNITNGSWQMKADDVMISSEFVKPELYLRKGYFITPAVTSWENMGKTALVRESYEDVVVGGFVLMMCPFYIDGIFEEYLNHFFQSTLFQQYCRSITNKSGQAFYNLSRNKLLQLLVPIPPVKEQQRIYHKLNDALASIMSR